MLCLGIETTAHTFGMAVVDSDGNILSNVFKSFTTEQGGMIPAQVAQHHVDVCGEVLKDTLAKARKKLSDIDIVAFSQSPGIGHCLRIGAMAAKSLAVLLDKPLVGVNHCISHLEIGRLLCKCDDPVLLYTSGANTQVIAYEGEKYRIFGETLDIGVGNFIDTFARAIGLGFPGGPKVEQLARQGKKLIPLPYVVKGMDVSFGGLLTNLKNKWKTGKYVKEDLCFSLQETVFAMLVEVAERAMAHTGKQQLLLAGGVACNKRLQEMATMMCKERDAQCFFPEKQYLVDNPAMIAWLGTLYYKVGNVLKVKDAKILPYLRTDDVDVNWR